MMKSEYIKHDIITKEILDSIKVGDLIKCNNWKSSLRVMAVSENYFVMVRNCFNKPLYSVCEKLPAKYSRNSFTKGSFRIGTDNMIFGSGYDYFDKKDMKVYLNEFEIGDKQVGIELSDRRAVDLNVIYIKKVK